MNSKVVVENDWEGEGAEVFDICRKCLHAGVKGAVERSLEYARYLEARALLHRERLPKILRMVPEWKTGLDYDAVMEEREKAFREEHPITEEEIARELDTAAAFLSDDDIPF